MLEPSRPATSLAAPWFAKTARWARYAPCFQSAEAGFPANLDSSDSTRSLWLGPNHESCVKPGRPNGAEGSLPTGQKACPHFGVAPIEHALRGAGCLRRVGATRQEGRVEPAASWKLIASLAASSIWRRRMRSLSLILDRRGRQHLVAEVGAKLARGAQMDLPRAQQAG